MELCGFADGRAELRLAVRPEHHNSWGVAHGGVVMTMLDVAMAQAARSVLVRERGDASQVPGLATIEMKTSFMRPAQGRLRAVGELLHHTPTLAFTEGRVYDEHDHLCAHASGTFKYLSGLPVSSHDAKRLQRAGGAGVDA